MRAGLVLHEYLWLGVTCVCKGDVGNHAVPYRVTQSLMSLVNVG